MERERECMGERQTEGGWEGRGKEGGGREQAMKREGGEERYRKTWTLSRVKMQCTDVNNDGKKKAAIRYLFV